MIKFGQFAGATLPDVLFMKDDGEVGVWAIKTHLIVSLPSIVVFLEEHPIDVAFLQKLVDELEGPLIILSPLFPRLFPLITHYLRVARIGHEAVEPGIEIQAYFRRIKFPRSFDAQAVLFLPFRLCLLFYLKLSGFSFCFANLHFARHLLQSALFLCLSHPLDFFPHTSSSKFLLGFATLFLWCAARSWGAVFGC